MMAGPRTRFYRDKRNGRWAGVCAGFADYFGIDVTLVRIGFIATTLLTGWGLLVYLITAWTAPVKTDAQFAGQAPEEQKFWQQVRKNPRRTARTVRARFRDMDRRLAAVEAYVTSPDKRLAREIDQLR
jgi:phage shock protein C